MPVGLGSADLTPAYLDLLGADGHLIVFGDTETGKTNLLRAVIAGLAARHRPDELLFAIVDYRRTLLEAVGEDRILAYAGSAPAATDSLKQVAAGLGVRLPGAEVTPAQLRARSWWTGPEIVVVVDDYDLVAGAGVNPLEPLLPYLPQARDVGLHMVIARRSGGAARAIFDPVLQRMRELRLCRAAAERRPCRRPADRRGGSRRAAHRSRCPGPPTAAPGHRADLLAGHSGLSHFCWVCCCLF